MPQLEIPKFSGDYARWTLVKDLYFQMIQQRELTDSEKFMYLRGSLTGEAFDLIQLLRVSPENYDLAWEMLNELYENPRQIIKAMLTKLFTMDKAKPNHYASLKKSYDVFRENMFAVRIAAKNNDNLIEMILIVLIV